MIKDRFYYIDDNEVTLNFPEIDVDEKKVIEEYVEISRHLIELGELYNMFRCNLDILSNYFIMNFNDCLEYKGKLLSEEEIFTLLNTLTNNFISSGKTLVDSIEIYVKSNFEETDFEIFKKNIISKMYDEAFSYRFLLQLRNYSQHGHIPVDYEQGKASFNLNYILNQKHFEMNKKVNTELKEIQEVIVNNLNGYPRIVFVHSLIEFDYSVTKIFNDFIKFIKDSLKESREKINHLVLKRPELINSGTEYEGLIAYDSDDGTKHFIIRDENILEVYSKIRKKVKDDLKKEEMNLKISEKKFQ